MNHFGRRWFWHILTLISTIVLIVLCSTKGDGAVLSGERCILPCLAGEGGSQRGSPIAALTVVVEFVEVVFNRLVELASIAFEVHCLHKVEIGAVDKPFFDVALRRDLISPASRAAVFDCLRVGQWGYFIFHTGRSITKQIVSSLSVKGDKVWFVIVSPWRWVSVGSGVIGLVPAVVVGAAVAVGKQGQHRSLE